jgi:hypothetical protein
MFFIRSRKKLGFGTANTLILSKRKLSKNVPVQFQWCFAVKTLHFLVKIFSKSVSQNWFVIYIYIFLWMNVNVKVLKSVQNSKLFSFKKFTENNYWSYFLAFKKTKNLSLSMKYWNTTKLDFSTIRLLSQIFTTMNSYHHDRVNIRTFPQPSIHIRVNAQLRKVIIK